LPSLHQKPSDQATTRFSNPGTLDHRAFIGAREAQTPPRPDMTPPDGVRVSNRA
jgi:hypothetical protein